MSRYSEEEWSTLPERTDAIGRTDRTRELDRPVSEQAESANRLLSLALFLVAIVSLTMLGLAAWLSAETAAPSPALAMIMAAGGGGATGAVGMLSTLGGVVYLSVFCVNAGHMAYMRWHKGREAARQAAAKYLEDERHAR